MAPPFFKFLCQAQGHNCSPFVHYLQCMLIRSLTRVRTGPADGDVAADAAQSWKGPGGGGSGGSGGDVGGGGNDGSRGNSGGSSTGFVGPSCVLDATERAFASMSAEAQLACMGRDHSSPWSNRVTQSASNSGPTERRSRHLPADPQDPLLPLHFGPTRPSLAPHALRREEAAPAAITDQRPGSALSRPGSAPPARAAGRPPSAGARMTAGRGEGRPPPARPQSAMLARDAPVDLLRVGLGRGGGGEGNRGDSGARVRACGTGACVCV